MFSGSLVALATPMLPNGDIDYLALERLVRWHIQSKTDGLVILGTTGESATITDTERSEMMQLVIATANRAIPVIVGTGSNSTRTTIHYTQTAERLGADAVLLVTPYYNKPMQEGLYRHFAAIAQAASIPQILYNVPTRTVCDLLPETIARLAAFPNIVGVKEATGDLSRLKKLLAFCPSMHFFSGDDKTAMEFMLQGGHGVISVVANVLPEKSHALCKAAIQGDRVLAEEIDAAMQQLIAALFIETNPIPTKWALAKMGLIQDGIRLPLTPLHSQYHQTVSLALTEALCVS